MNIEIFPEKCIACGLCQLKAPTVFDYNDEGIVLFKDAPETRQLICLPTNQTAILQAYQACPTRAIVLHE